MALQDFQEKWAAFPLSLGCMGLAGTWNPAEMNAERQKRAVAAFEAALEAGFVVYDHADIYGGGTCEEVFKACLAAVPGSREKIVVATKGGIRSGHYNLSAPYLEECIERSLRRMGLDAIDLYQLHRPDPLTHPRETAAALNKALKAQKILAVGVSNYYPEQVRALQNYLDAPLVSNQVRISLYHLDAIYEGWPTQQESSISLTGDGALDQCMALGLTPMAYSPLGGGRIARGLGDNDKHEAIQAKLGELSEKYGRSPVQIALAWLLSHPAGIMPIVGSANPEHIREAAGAADLRLEREDWYALWTAAWGRRVP